MTACFLIGVGFFPRLTLLLCWLTHAMPTNTTPFLIDIIGVLFAPRLLIAYWLFAGGYSYWLVAIFTILGLFGDLGLTLGGSEQLKKQKRTSKHPFRK